jgi:hypothetical protein
MTSPEPAPSAVAWAPYVATDAILLALVLAAAAAVLAWIGARLVRPLGVRRPGPTVAGLLIGLWALSILMFVVAGMVYLVQIGESFPALAARAAEITQRTGHPPRARAVNVGTFLDAAIAFFAILYLTRRFGRVAALASALIGSAAAPMLFEAPFDLIVMTRSNPVIPSHPALYRVLFFLPLFLIELSTVSLLSLLPSFRITRGSLLALAAMFAVFAVWAALGFAYPNQPLPLALNIVSKLLCFVAGVLFFVWREQPSDHQQEAVRRVRASSSG